MSRLEKARHGAYETLAGVARRGGFGHDPIGLQYTVALEAGCTRVEVAVAVAQLETEGLIERIIGSRSGFQYLRLPQVEQLELF